MVVFKLTEDTPLTELFNNIPETKEVLMKYGLKKLIDDKVEDIVVKRLTIKGFMKLMNLSEEQKEELWIEIENLYNNKFGG